MKRLICSAAVASVLLGASGIASIANAATLSFLGESGTGLTATLFGTNLISGSVNGDTALAFTSDWVEFTVTPTTSTTLNANTLAPPADYPGETWQVTSGSTTGSVVLASSANNIPASAVLTAGTDYFLELNSTKPTSGAGSSFSVSVPSVAATPLPDTLALFAGGLGLLLGISTWRKRKNAGRPSMMVAAAA
jgi:hypothetical protein